MRYLKKFLLVGFITSILILSFSFSVCALSSTIDYTVLNSDGQNAVPPLHLSEHPDEVCGIIFSQNSSGYGYWLEYYLPDLTGRTYFAGFISGDLWFFGTNTTSSGYLVNSVPYYIYGEDGTLISSGTSSMSSTASTVPANTLVPRAMGKFTPFKNYSTNACISWFIPMLNSVECINNRGTTITSDAINTGWGFTFNQDPTQYDPETGEPIGGGGNTGGCTCNDYTDILLEIVTNQGNQLTKLDTIISILQNYNNDDVVDAVNDAVDQVINSDPGSSPPEALDPDDFPDKESDLLDDLPGIDDDDVDSIGEHVSLDSDAIAWWYERFTDVTSNTKFRAVMLTMLSLAVIGFVLNKRGVL